MSATNAPVIYASLLAMLLAADQAYPDNRLAHKRLASYDSIIWPRGTEVLRFENVEGIILLRGTLSGRLRRTRPGPLRSTPGRVTWRSTSASRAS